MAVFVTGFSVTSRAAAWYEFKADGAAEPDKDGAVGKP